MRHKMTRAQFKVGLYAVALAGLVAVDVALITTPVLPLLATVACAIGGVAMLTLGARIIFNAAKEMRHRNTNPSPTP